MEIFCHSWLWLWLASTCVCVRLSSQSCVSAQLPRTASPTLTPSNNRVWLKRSTYRRRCATKDKSVSFSALLILFEISLATLDRSEVKKSHLICYIHQCFGGIKTLFCLDPVPLHEFIWIIWQIQQAITSLPIWQVFCFVSVLLDDQWKLEDQDKKQWICIICMRCAQP